MTDDLDEFWRSIVATKRRAEADEAAEMAAAERQFALDDATTPDVDPAGSWSEERIDAAVHRALASAPRMAGPAAPAGPRRRLTPPRLLAAVAVLLLVSGFTVAGTRWAVQEFRDIVLHRASQTVTYSRALRVLTDVRHHPLSRQAAQRVVDSHLRSAIDVLKQAEAEDRPVGAAATTALDRLRQALQGSGPGDDLPAGDVVALWEEVGDADLPAGERVAAIARITPLLLEGIAALAGIATEPPTAETEVLHRHNGLVLNRLQERLGQ